MLNLSLRLHHHLLLLPLLLLPLGCSTRSTDPGAGDLGRAITVGSDLRVSLPPTQSERLHTQPAAGSTVLITVSPLAAASGPLSLSVYPLLATGASGRQRPASDYPLPPFQRTGIPPLDARATIPATWKPDDVLIIELKNIGGGMAELNTQVRVIR